jgi:hypothetical protein
MKALGLKGKIWGWGEVIKQNKGVRFEVFTAMTMKNVIFWDVTPHGLCKN